METYEDMNEKLASEYEASRDEFDFGYILVGLFLVLAMLYATGNLGGGDKTGSTEPVEEDDRVTPYTLEEIRKYDGKGPDSKIFIGCNGFVFDVTKSENFQEGGMYGSFAGNDISMACANFSTDEKYLGQVYDPETTVLNFSKQDSLQTFYMGFCQKYTVKGRVVL